MVVKLWGRCGGVFKVQKSIERAKSLRTIVNLIRKGTVDFVTHVKMSPGSRLTSEVAFAFQRTNDFIEPISNSQVMLAWDSLRLHSNSDTCFYLNSKWKAIVTNRMFSVCNFNPRESPNDSQVFSGPLQGISPPMTGQATKYANVTTNRKTWSHPESPALWYSEHNFKCSMWDGLIFCRLSGLSL